MESWFRLEEFIHGACVLMVDWKSDSDDLCYSLVLQIIMTSRSCKNHPDCFCYICSEYKTVDNRKSIIDFAQKAYYAYFGIKLGHKDKKQASPHVVCKACVERLRQWTSGTKKSMGFGIQMVLREASYYIDNCYFCSKCDRGK